ncbi:MAG: polyphosphate kinase 2 family protein [Pyrinomonadaceae bacterium]|nr:polyphosphate kinase 2 family protein [Pyrinomonadaceae bacterium]
MEYVHRIEGERKISLSDFDPEETHGLKRNEAEEKMSRLTEELVELQELLYAANDTRLLVILQGRDTSGKDGAIRGVFGPLNSQGCEIASFKVPTEAELAHDFLWRVHLHAPASGQIVVFNRSHYEDVLVVRVHHLAEEKIWRGRYDHINNFERLLADSNTIILKFYLHISREEQEKRLMKREQDATKFWKLSVGDWKEREHWDDYTVAYEDAINKCSAPHAPWFIVPANKKWFRNLAIAEALVNALKPYKENWLKRLEKIGERELAAIEEFRRAAQSSGAKT